MTETARREHLTLENEKTADLCESPLTTRGFPRSAVCPLQDRPFQGPHVRTNAKLSRVRLRMVSVRP